MKLRNSVPHVLIISQWNSGLKRFSKNRTIMNIINRIKAALGDDE